jgi:hypothetical protein
MILSSKLYFYYTGEFICVKLKRNIMDQFILHQTKEIIDKVSLSAMGLHHNNNCEG